MNTKFFRPSAAAPNRSDCTAMRLRSRLVTWTIDFDAAILQQLADGARVHGHARARRFGDVERVDRAAQQLGGGEQLGEIGALRGRQLAGDDELLGGNFRRETVKFMGAILTRPQPAWQRARPHFH